MFEDLAIREILKSFSSLGNLTGGGCSYRDNRRKQMRRALISSHSSSLCTLRTVSFMLQNFIS